MAFSRALFFLASRDFFTACNLAFPRPPVLTELSNLTRTFEKERLVVEGTLCRESMADAEREWLTIATLDEGAVLGSNPLHRCRPGLDIE